MEIDWTDLRGELAGYGYVFNEEKDMVMARSCLDVTISRIKSFTNCPTLSEKIRPELLRMACGEFLYRKKITGQLNNPESGINFPHRVTQWSEGDTSISLTAAGKTEEADFTAYLDKIRKGDPWVLEHFRQLDWR